MKKENIDMAVEELLRWAEKNSGIVHEFDRNVLASKREVTRALLIAWMKSPDQRLCQFISNLHGPGKQDIFHTTDEQLMNMCKDHE